MCAASRERADRLLVLLGLADTRNKAQALILAGRVHWNRRRVDKPGQLIPSDADLQVSEGERYVGRGGHKLAGALSRFGIEISGQSAIDVGASTGGFTQVLLEHGASRVIALDVGRGQLDWKLRQDPRVIVMEGVNARHLDPADLPFPPDLAVLDVSFISLDLVVPPVMACLPPEGELVALIKPQFEVGRRDVGRGGVVRDPELHRSSVARVALRIAERGAAVLAVAPSVLPGATGNQEFFVHAAADPEHRRALQPADVERAVGRAVLEAGEVER